jgi:hypothetical protein
VRVLYRIILVVREGKLVPTNIVYPLSGGIGGGALRPSTVELQAIREKRIALSKETIAKYREICNNKRTWHHCKVG